MLLHLLASYLSVVGYSLNLRAADMFLPTPHCCVCSQMNYGTFTP